MTINGVEEFRHFRSEVKEIEKKKKTCYNKQTTDTSEESPPLVMVKGIKSDPAGGAPRVEDEK